MGPCEPPRPPRLPVDGAQQPLDEACQVLDLGGLVGEDGPVQRGELGEALQRVLGHVRVLPDLAVHLRQEPLARETTFSRQGQVSVTPHAVKVTAAGPF